MKKHKLNRYDESGRDYFTLELKKYILKSFALHLKETGLLDNVSVIFYSLQFMNVNNGVQIVSG